MVAGDDFYRDMPEERRWALTAHTHPNASTIEPLRRPVESGQFCDAGRVMAERTAWRIRPDNGWWSAFGKCPRGRRPVSADQLTRTWSAASPPHPGTAATRPLESGLARITAAAARGHRTGLSSWSDGRPSVSDALYPDVRAGIAAVADRADPTACSAPIPLDRLHG